MVRNRVLSEEAKDCRKNEERYNERHGIIERIFL